MTAKEQGLPAFTLAEVAAFIDGTAPLDGVWFGDRHPTEAGSYWWRKHLKDALAATLTPLGDKDREAVAQGSADGEDWAGTFTPATVAEWEANGCPLARELRVLRQMCSCGNDELSVDEAEAKYLELRSIATRLAESGGGEVDGGLAAYRVRDFLSQKFGVMLSIKSADELLALAYTTTPPAAAVADDWFSLWNRLSAAVREAGFYQNSDNGRIYLTPITPPTPTAAVVAKVCECSGQRGHLAGDPGYSCKSPPTPSAGVSEARALTFAEAVEVLAAHQDWRVGEHNGDCIPPEALSEAICTVVDKARAALAAAEGVKGG